MSGWYPEAAGAGAALVGETIWWPTENIPDDFLELDGSSLDKGLYNELFDVLGYRYGGAGANFSLPDARGNFIRSWDNTRGRDPDSGTRTDRGDGTTGDNVGTNQDDQFKSHVHQYRDAYTAGFTGGINLGPFFGLQNTTGAGGNETRGKNISFVACMRWTR